MLLFFEKRARHFNESEDCKKVVENNQNGKMIGLIDYRMLEEKMHIYSSHKTM